MIKAERSSGFGRELKATAGLDSNQSLGCLL